MNFPLDNSTQTNTALATTGTSYTYVNSNDLSTKQNVLDASTNLLGIGTSISALNYNNITLNKPTNFQSDWTSTIINKPTNFQRLESAQSSRGRRHRVDWGTFIEPRPPALVGVQSQCPARIEPAPPWGGPHGEHGAAQGPHSTPAQNTEAEYRASLLGLPRRTRAPWPRIHLLGHWAVD